MNYTTTKYLIAVIAGLASALLCYVSYRMLFGGYSAIEADSIYVRQQFSDITGSLIKWFKGGPSHNGRGNIVADNT